MLGGSASRVLAIHATSNGFAYCIFEGARCLIDFGIKHVTKPEKNKHCLSLVEQLIVRYDPHNITIEDVDEHGSKRSMRVRHLYRDLEKMADRSGIVTYAYPWPVVFSVFKNARPKTRHDIAIVVAEILPDIRRRLPPKRKIWLPQDPRQALFDAAAIGITYYSVHDA